MSIDTIEMNFPEVTTPLATSFKLRDGVKQSIDRYLTQLGGAKPANVYDLVLAEVEAPLLESILKYTRGNQSRAAIILGISRGTLRKKLKLYGLED